LANEYVVTPQYQPRLSSITKKFSRRISQSDCSIHIKLNYYWLTFIEQYFSYIQDDVNKFNKNYIEMKEGM